MTQNSDGNEDGAFIPASTLFLALADECWRACESLERLQVAVSPIAAGPQSLSPDALRELQSVDALKQILGGLARFHEATAACAIPNKGVSRHDLARMIGLPSLADRLAAPTGRLPPVSDGDVTFF